MKRKISVFIFSALCASLSFSQNWLSDFEEAKKLAAKENKPIVLVFQGSDWCAPCIKLDREIWSSKEFKNYSSGHYVLLKADFPRKKKNSLSAEQAQANAILAEKYNKQGIFPFVVVMDKTGNVLGETGYRKTSPASYIDLLNSYIQ